MATTSDETILERIENRYILDGSCKIWTGLLKRKTTPNISVMVSGKQSKLQVQRFIWKVNNEELDPRDTLETTCKNSKCVNVEYFRVIRCRKTSNHTSSTEEAIELIEKSTSTEEGCVIWQGPVDGTFSRPRFSLFIDGKQMSTDVQRYVWNLTHEKITRHHILTTSCSNTSCVKPDHLVILPKAEPPDWDKIWSRMLLKTKAEGSCLIWTASKLGSYGQSSLQGHTILAHKLSYLVKTRGEDIPKEIDGETAQIRHLCGNRLCIAPKCLVLGTILENAKDRDDHGTQIRGETSPLAKISEKLASQIKLSKYKEGDPGYSTQQERADYFGVPKTTVKAIDRGLVWSHLKDSNGNTSSRVEIRERARKRNKKNQDKEWTIEDYEKAGKKLYTMVSKSSTSKKTTIDGECWNFTGYVQNGYGSVSILGKRKGAHVMSCEIKEKRSITKGEHTIHLCRNSLCIAPHHLDFGCPKSNSITVLNSESRVAKLDEDKVRKIRDLSHSKSDLASEFNVSEDTIRNVRDGRTWTHVV